MKTYQISVLTMAISLSCVNIFADSSIHQKDNNLLDPITSDVFFENDPLFSVEFLPSDTSVSDVFFQGIFYPESENQKKTELDLNRDSITDYYRSFDNQGNILREALDADQDGVEDLVWDYSRGTKTFRQDLNHDEMPEETWDVTADTQSPSIVTYVHGSDKNGDGLIDYRATYTVDPEKDSFPILLEEDSNLNGQFDWKQTTIAKRIQYKGSASDVSPSSSCTAEQAQRLKDAFKSMIKKSASCFNRMDSASKGLNFLRFVSTSKIKIVCTQKSEGYCGSADNADQRYVWYRGEIPITITGDGFENPACRPLESTLFHEIMHYIDGVHEIGDGTTDPADPIYGCEKACFGGGNSQHCAQCLKTRQGDKRCNSFPQQPCPESMDIAYCGCPKDNPRFYPTASQCDVGCPTGLACFGYQCQSWPRGPCY